jgi:thymidine kinase
LVLRTFSFSHDQDIFHHAIKMSEPTSPLGITPGIASKSRGWIEVICGPMFSGKTEELIRRLRRAQIARLKVAIFKPLIDDRYAVDRLVSHNEISLPSLAVRSSGEILDRVGDAQVLGIDAPANRTQRLSSESQRVVVGAQDRYEARCRVCFEPPQPE